MCSEHILCDIVYFGSCYYDFIQCPNSNLAHSASGFTINHSLIKWAWDSTSIFSLIYRYVTSEGSGATAHLGPSPFANIMIVVYSAILSLIFTEISPYETPNNGASGMGMHCLPMSHKVITPTNCFIPITHAQ